MEEEESSIPSFPQLPPWIRYLKSIIRIGREENITKSQANKMHNA